MMCRFPSKDSILYGHVLGSAKTCTRRLSCGWVDGYGCIGWVGAGYAGSSQDNNRCVPIIIYTYKYVSTM